MRFHADGPSIPDSLLERCDAGRVVFLCGAGVSMPSKMPSFVGLTKYVIDHFDPPADSEIMAAFNPWREDEQSETNIPLDQIFNLLHREYGKNEVNALVTERLSIPVELKDFEHKHELIKRISSSANRAPQIVTTNFDRLFEGGDTETFEPPAFPDLNFGESVEGITYLHGRLVDADSEIHPYVLSSADFGRAYLSEAWATNFVRHLLEKYTVVLVGYKAEDPPIKYLLQGLNHDGQYDSSKLYAFDRGLPEEIEVKWRDRGVTAIAYAEHDVLWKTMEAWAERADDPRKWRASIITKSQTDPKLLTPHERGQIAHVLRTVQGARLFAEADPIPHPEWVCVMDANIRSAKQGRGYGKGAEVFDPQAAYGLDDDRTDISDEDRRYGIVNDNLLIWRSGDDTPHDAHRLGGCQYQGHETISKRLLHLITWCRKSMNSPVLAWWASRQFGLHPQLIRQIEWRLETDKSLVKRARYIWNLILENQRDTRNRQMGSDWYSLKSRIEIEGWTESVLREFRRVATPRITIELPLGLERIKPPSSLWEKISISDIGLFEVKFLEHSIELDVPDQQLHQVISILEGNLRMAVGLLKDLGVSHFPVPTFYLDREVDGDISNDEVSEIFSWFVKLFDRLTINSPGLAKVHALAWPATDQYFFRKFKLYALNNCSVFDAKEVTKEILSFDQDSFWDDGVARELLFLLADRWSEFCEESRSQLADSILAGPDKFAGYSEEKFGEVRKRYTARYARYLELQGCELGVERSRKLAGIIAEIDSWEDSWANSTVAGHGTRVDWIDTDDAPGDVLNLPDNEVIPRAREVMGRDIESFTDRRPFMGLVKSNPRKALAALTIEGKTGNYPADLWEELINGFSIESSCRLKSAFLNRIVRLPKEVIVQLRHTLPRWLDKNLASIIEFDNDLGWKVYDSIISSILDEGDGATVSGLGEVRMGGAVVQRSRRTLNHAVNGPVGICAQALFKVVPGEKQEAGSLIPECVKSRVEILFDAPGEGADHAVSITFSKLNWLMFVDPDWTKERLVPMLDVEHPAAEPAWNGFLHSNRIPWLPLAEIVKPTLIGLFPWVEGFLWERNLAAVAARWLGSLRLFHFSKPSGLTQREMRTVLRSMSDETRNHFIFGLGQVGKQNKDGWIEYVVPLIVNDWPLERQFRTAASTNAWINLLDDTGEYFPVVYKAVKKFLVPVEASSQMIYRFTREGNDGSNITKMFPEDTLDLMDRITPQSISHPPFNLPKVLALIEESDSRLASDTRYLRLIDLIERS